MTDTSYDPDTGQPNQVTLSRRDIKRLEKQAQAGKEALQELEQLRKERAYAAAGIPLDDKRLPYFVAGYSGEMTAQAIKAKWDEDFGPVAGSGDPALDAELAQMNAATNLLSREGGDLSDSRLAERNAKLAELSPTDPRYPEKFDQIFNEYGGQGAAHSGLPHGL